ncbi:thiol-disulfide oxidoreductase DCC family protein [Streptomyces sp. NPDC052040]|uniref:thiol-disulfide oxidoreductase DCC family protein n=1 Tax=unclassified Streptomyces TaxID=2593676 RepID=UPI0037D10141
MPESVGVPRATSAPASVVLFDGECGFCRAATGYLVRRLHLQGELRPWQSADLASYRLTRSQAEQRLWFITAERRTGGAAAFADWFSTGDRTARTAGRLIALPGVRHLAQAVYGLVARNRHRIPGPWEHTCRI